MKRELQWRVITPRMVGLLSNLVKLKEKGDGRGGRRRGQRQKKKKYGVKQPGGVSAITSAGGKEATPFTAHNFAVKEGPLKRQEEKHDGLACMKNG